MYALEALTPATEAQVTGVLEVLGAVVSFVLEKITDVVNIVMANPLLLIPIGVILLYTIISTFRRLF